MLCDGTEAHARSSDPGTSHAAAASVRATDLESRVLNAIRNCPKGATSSELESLTKLTNQSLTPRFAPMRRKGLIYDSGEKRKGESGRMQIVWRYTGSSMQEGIDGQMEWVH
jgi:hypothetical protein